MKENGTETSRGMAKARHWSVWVTLCGLLWLVGVSVSSASGFRIVDSEKGRLHIYEGDKPVLTYNYGMQLAEGVPENRRRACYVHPLYGMEGEVLTDDFPKDHTHHRGISWMWPRMRVGGEDVELWHIQGIRQHFDHWAERQVSPAHARLKVVNAWKLADGQRVAREEVTIEAQPATEVGRAVDFKLRFEALKEPIMLLGQVDKGYGGFCFRFAPRQGTQITTDEGAQEDSDLERFPWADLSARFHDRESRSGAAIFVNPENPGYPNGWTLRHYGFLGPCWPGVEEFGLRPGESVTLRYRVWAHRGGAEEGKVAEAYHDYVE